MGPADPTLFILRLRLSTLAFRGLHPRTPTFFSLVGKEGKSTHRGGTLSMGSLPYEPHLRDDTKGGACPPLDNPQPVLRTVRGPLLI